METASQPAPSILHLASSLKHGQASLAAAPETAEPVALRTPPPSAQKVGWLRSAMPVCAPIPLGPSAGGHGTLRNLQSALESAEPVTLLTTFQMPVRCTAQSV